MSASSLQKKINNAYKKVGKLIGYNYDIYRPLNNINVLAIENYISTVNFTVTLNNEYTKAMEGQTPPIWTAYTDNIHIKEGDFILNEEKQRTFFVMSMKDHLPTLVIEVPDRIDIKQVAYNDTGDGFEPGNSTYLVRNLPAFITYGSVLEHGPYNSRIDVAGVRTLDVFTCIPTTISLMGQSLLDTTDFHGDIVSYDNPFLGAGTRIKAQEFGVK